MAPAAIVAGAVAAASGIWRARRRPRRPDDGEAQARGSAPDAAVGALADAHASVATLAGLHAGAGLAADVAIGGVLLAITANAVSRCAVAWIAGGAGYAVRIALSLAVSTGAGWAVAVGVGGLGAGAL